MSEETIAKAYIQILPSMSGIRDAIKEELGDDGEAAGKESGKKFSKSFGGALAGLGKVVTAAVASGAAAAGKLAKDAVEGFADYEQLVGGVETLFQGSADQVQQYAEEAFKTAGLSANEYMETVTGFSASLIQATGRGAQQDVDALQAHLDEEYKATKRQLEDQYDLAKKYMNPSELKALKRDHEDQLAALKETNKSLVDEAERMNNVSVSTEESLARAADLANQAVIDMADNANKMGTDMESIQNAYQGFAKQNFTMLDNLKLGYGGTKQEMERLLGDAERLSGVKYDVSSYADIVEAIHVIQTELGITGTTAKEASETISGSVAAMKSAWDNLIVGLANDNADLDALIDNVVESAETALGNILPVAEKTLGGIASLIERLAPLVADKLPALVEELLPPLLSAATGLVNALVAALPSILQVLIDVAPDIINEIIETVVELLPEIVQLGLDLIVALAHGIAENLETLIPAVTEAVLTIVELLTEPETLEQLVGAAAHLIAALAVGLIEALPVLLEKVPEIMANLAASLIESIPLLIEAVFEISDHVAAAIADLIKDAGNWGRDLIDNFVQGIKDRVQHVIDTVKQIAENIKQYIGFSEPELGPLANFHTFAPDMMELFAEGIRANEHLISDQIARTFDIGPRMIDYGIADLGALHVQPSPGAESDTAAADFFAGNITLNVTSQIDGQTLARNQYTYNLAEAQRRGTRAVN